MLIVKYYALMAFESTWKLIYVSEDIVALCMLFVTIEIIVGDCFIDRTKVPLMNMTISMIHYSLQKA